MGEAKRFITSKARSKVIIRMKRIGDIFFLAAHFGNDLTVFSFRTRKNN